MKKKIRYSDLQTATPAPLTKFTPVSSAVVVPAVRPPAPSAPTPKPAAKPKATRAKAPKATAPKADATKAPKTAAKSAAPRTASRKSAAPKTAKVAAPDAVAPEQDAPKQEIVAQPELPKQEIPTVVAVPVAPRPRRDSAPIELARALQQARAAEALQAAEILAHVEARAAAAHARQLAEAEAAATAAAPESDEDFSGGETKKPFVYARMAPPDENELDDDAFEVRGPRRPLRERARGRTGIVELLMFRIGAERFAVELVCVEEAIDLPEVHHVPEMPPAMLGVITVRETLTPVFTPNDALGVPVQGQGAALIFRSDRGRFALAIDDVDDVMTLDLAALRDAPGSEVADSVVLGVARNGDTIVALVDADALVLACQAIPVLELA